VIGASLRGFFEAAERAQTRSFGETDPAAPEMTGVRGRVHFVQGERHRESAWIFLDRTHGDVVSRFNEFGANELWQLLEALGP
jgi:hypothetical protein